MNTDAMLELFDNTARRWRLTDEQRHSLMKQGPLHEVAPYMAAISLGLGTLFRESEDAELHWLWDARSNLNGRTPLQCLLADREGMMRVLELVERERQVR